MANLNKQLPQVGPLTGESHCPANAAGHSPMDSEGGKDCLLNQGGVREGVEPSPKTPGAQTPAERSNIFERSSKVNRSPPLKTAQSKRKPQSPPGAERCAKKRDTDEEAENSTGLLELIQSFIIPTIRKVKSLVDNSKNTKKEIQEEVSNLATLAYRLEGFAEEARDNPTKMVKDHRTKETCEASTQTDNVMKDVDTQTNKPNDDMAAEVLKKLAEERNTEETIRLLERKWPEECFRRTSAKSKNFVRNSTEYRAILTTSIDKSSRLFKGLAGQYPYLENLENLGTVTKLTSSTTTTGEDGLPKTQQRTLVVVRPEETQEPPETQALRSTEALINAVGDTEHLDLLAPDKDTYLWRKALECALVNRELNVTICTKGTTKKQTEPKIKSCDLQVTAGGKTYAELVKEFKTAVADGNIMAEFSALSQTPNGDLKVKIKGDRAATKDAIEIIQRKLPQLQASTAGKRAVLHLCGLDPESTTDDIQRAIADASGTLPQDVCVSNTWTTPRGECKASVIVPKQTAQSLVRTGKIKVGFISVRVADRTRCRRCWGYGHSEERCRGPDKSTLCFNCSKPGHKSRDCAEEKRTFAGSKGTRPRTENQK